MIPLEELLGGLLAALLPGIEDRGSRIDGKAPSLVITELQLDVPVEATIAHNGTVMATTPRGLMSTGFELPLGRLRLLCEEAR